MNFEIPENKIIKLSAAERFAECLRIAAQQCGMNDVTYNRICPIKFSFSDGSEIGTLKLWVMAGVLPKSVLEPLDWPKKK